jgi:SSS family solute:Na+ symporter
VLLIVGVVLAYTITGGMFSDAYTAFIQVVITVIGSVALLIWVAVHYGITIPEGMGPFDLGQLTDSAQGAPINWATLISLGIGDIVAIDFMQRIFSAKSPETARRACFVGAAGTAIVGIPYALVALSSGAILGSTPTDGPVLFALLEGYAPAILTILVLSAIVAASCSTANGVILGTACVAVRNIAGLEQQADPAGGKDPLLRRVRLTMPLVVGIAIFFALRVPETGILLTLAFDLMLAGLVVPFVLGHWWSARVTTAAAAAAIAVGVVVRLTFFALTPSFYGVENTLLYIPNDLVGPGFDGWPTLIAPITSLVAFVAVALLRPRREQLPVENTVKATTLDEETAPAA